MQKCKNKYKKNDEDWCQHGICSIKNIKSYIKLGSNLGFLLSDIYCSRNTNVSSWSPSGINSTTSHGHKWQSLIFAEHSFIMYIPCWFWGKHHNWNTKPPSRFSFPPWKWATPPNCSNFEKSNPQVFFMSVDTLEVQQDSIPSWLANEVPDVADVWHECLWGLLSLRCINLMFRHEYEPSQPRMVVSLGI